MRAIHEASAAGDVSALRAAFADDAAFPNVRDECGATCLDHAIYHGPVALVRALLDLAADPNVEDPAGMPALFAAIDRTTPDRVEVLAMLLAAGADVGQRGVNDYTPLHYAASRSDVASIELLLMHGADPLTKTRIDHYATPAEEAEYLGHAAAAASIRRWLRTHSPTSG